MGGRLKRSPLDELCIHPVFILPIEVHITQVIIEWCHGKIQHCCRGITLSELRSREIWINNGNSAVRTLISECIICNSNATIHLRWLRSIWTT